MKIIEIVADKLKGSKLDPGKIDQIAGELDELAGKLEVGQIHAILFSTILSLNFKKRRVTIDQLAGHFGINGIQIMSYISELKELQRLRWIKSDMEGESKYAMLSDINFYITRDVFDRVIEEPDKNRTEKQKEVYEVLSEIMDLTVDFDRDRISHWEMMDEVRNLVSDNSTLPYFKILSQENLSNEEELIFMIVCQRVLNGDIEVDLDKLAQIAGGNSYESVKLKRSIIRGDSKLIAGDLIKLQDGLFRNDNEVALTDQSIRKFFKEDVDILIKSSINKNNVRNHDSIQAVRLFFNPAEHEKIDRLSRLISRKGYDEIRDRLKERKMRTGFTILLHGSPGTGKTEIVMQLARKSKRDVIRVDLSQTKSMWFGESEKKVKEIFNQYRQALKFSDMVPILLFNEADGLFGIRTSQQQSNTSQTFNTMQNILLEELENFEGILIATTNLTANFDKAFDRRFLYKIEFCDPDEATRKKIWRNKIPALTAQTAGQLAKAFSLSGGQIENVTRKYEIDHLLSGAEAAFDILASYCREEKLQRESRNVVGYR